MLIKPAQCYDIQSVIFVIFLCPLTKYTFLKMDQTKPFPLQRVSALMLLNAANIATRGRIKSLESLIQEETK